MLSFMQMNVWPTHNVDYSWEMVNISRVERVRFAKRQGCKALYGFERVHRQQWGLIFYYLIVAVLIIKLNFNLQTRAQLS